MRKNLNACDSNTRKELLQAEAKGELSRKLAAAMFTIRRKSDFPPPIERFPNMSMLVASLGTVLAVSAIPWLIFFVGRWLVRGFAPT